MRKLFRKNSSIGRKPLTDRKWFLVALPSTITGILGIAGALMRGSRSQRKEITLRGGIRGDHGPCVVPH